MSTMITEPTQKDSTKLLFKGLITGLLILVMLIPTFFVNSLVKEREERQKEIIQEVSSKWASQQQLAGPYISVPYIDTITDDKGKPYTQRGNLILLPETLNVDGNIIPYEKSRSIYKVLVYRSDIKANGAFNIKLPEDIRAEKIDFAKAKICIGISDYKGIEEAIAVNFNNTVYNLSPGLPTTQVSNTGLSAPIALSATDLEKPLSFSSTIKIKGSSGLYFLPLSSNSKFQLNST